MNTHQNLKKAKAHVPYLSRVNNENNFDSNCEKIAESSKTITSKNFNAIENRM